MIDLAGLSQVLWPDHCVQGTEGAELVDGLEGTPISAVVRKGTDPGVDSYSGFADNGHRNRTGLAGLLQDVSAYPLSNIRDRADWSTG